MSGPWAAPKALLAGLGCAQGQHCWAQLHNFGSGCRGQSCVKHEKRRGLLALSWVLSLSSVHAPMACPSHSCYAGQWPVWPGSSPVDCTCWLGLRSSSWPGLALWSLWLTWLPSLALILTWPCWPGSLTWPQTLLISVALSGWLNQTYQTHLLWVLHRLLVRALPLPALLHILPSVMELLIPGSWWFFSFHCLPSKSLELVLWLVLHSKLLKIKLYKSYKRWNHAPWLPGIIWFLGREQDFKVLRFSWS